jgi:allantoate deiminase
VGRIEAQPGASNVIAGLCRSTLDVRHADDRVRIEARDGLHRSAMEIASRRSLTVGWEPRLDEAAVAMAEPLVAGLTRAVKRAGTSPVQFSSGAGHDAMIMAQHMPAAMLLLRSPGGISHHPDEAVVDTDVALALAAGRGFLEDLASEAHD